MFTTFTMFTSSLSGEKRWRTVHNMFTMFTTITMFTSRLSGDKRENMKKKHQIPCLPRLPRLPRLPCLPKFQKTYILPHIEPHMWFLLVVKVQPLRLCIQQKQEGDVASLWLSLPLLLDPLNSVLLWPPSLCDLLSSTPVFAI